MIIRKAKTEDLDRIMQVYALAREFMVKTGNPHQWGDEGYPPRALIEEDIEVGRLYVVEDNGVVEGVFMFDKGPDNTYFKIDGAWLNDDDYVVIHRIASSGNKKGVLRLAVEFAKAQCNNMKIDTHEQNVVMQSALQKLGFKRCGIIYLENGDPRIAFQLN